MRVTEFGEPSVHMDSCLHTDKVARPCGLLHEL